MKSDDKTKEQLINTLAKLRKRNAELEKSKAEYKKMAQSLEESNEKSKNIAELITDGIITFDLKGVVSSVNNAFLELTGFPRDKIVGRHFSKLPTLCVNDIPGYLKLFSSMIMGKIPEPFEFLWIHKDGTERWGEGYFCFLRRGRKKVGMQAILKDITERKQAEEKLRESAVYLDIMGDALMILDSEARVVKVNKRFSDLWGYSPDEAIGKPVFEIFPERELPKHQSEMEKEVKERSIRMFETIALTKENKEIDVSVSGTALKDEKGILLNFIALFRDITERKKAEDELRSSEERLKILFEYAPDAYYLSDLKGNFIDGNLTAEDLLGYKRSELIGNSFLKLKLLSAKEIVKAAKLLANNVLGKGTGPDEFTLHRKDGTMVITEIRTYPVKIKEQTLVLGIARDITERKQAEEALRENEGKMRIMFESIADGIIITDLEANIIEVNKSVLRMGKFNHKEELVGRNAFDFVSPKDRVKAMENLNKEIELGESIEDIEYSLLTADGGEFDIESRATIMRDNSGNPVALINVIRDITKRKQAEEKIKENEEQLKKSLKEKEILIKEIFHRVKNNLAVVSGLLNIQAANIKDKKAKAALQETRDRIFSLSAVHSQLYHSENYSNVDYKKYIKKLVSNIFYSSQMSGHVKLHLDLADITLPMDKAIPCGLLLNEIVTNALKYAFPEKRKGNLRIITRSLEDKNCEIIVKDDGIGIPESFNIEKTETLGLKLIDLMAKQIEGTLEIESKKGTEFRIRLSTEPGQVIR